MVGYLSSKTSNLTPRDLISESHLVALLIGENGLIISLQSLAEMRVALFVIRHQTEICHGLCLLGVVGIIDDVNRSSTFMLGNLKILKPCAQMTSGSQKVKR